MMSSSASSSLVCISLHACMQDYFLWLHASSLLFNPGNRKKQPPTRQFRSFFFQDGLEIWGMPVCACMEWMLWFDLFRTPPFPSPRLGGMETGQKKLNPPTHPLAPLFFSSSSAAAAAKCETRVCVHTYIHPHIRKMILTPTPHPLNVGDYS